MISDVAASYICVCVVSSAGRKVDWRYFILMHFNLVVYETVILTASICKVYVTWRGTNVKLPEEDTEMSKHVGVYIM
jgi:hypothetical protein